MGHNASAALRVCLEIRLGTHPTTYLRERSAGRLGNTLQFLAPVLHDGELPERGRVVALDHHKPPGVWRHIKLQVTSCATVLATKETSWFLCTEDASTHINGHSHQGVT